MAGSHRDPDECLITSDSKSVSSRAGDIGCSK
jgi:hypothetical protein